MSRVNLAAGAPLKLLFLAALATVAYLPALTQPFIEDDYPIIALSRSYGPIDGWAKMAEDPVNRVRATTFVLTHWIEALFGLNPVAFYSVSLLLHIFNCWLVFALGRWQPIGYRVSFWAAAFFAIYEGHQEAVMWYAAANELLLFFFGAICFISWLLFRERQHWRWLLSSLIFFLLALLSKESSIIFVPLLAVPLLNKTGAKRLGLLLPFGLLAGIYVFQIMQTRDQSFRFHDQSFVLSAPFWETWLKGFFALLLPWGWLAIISLVFWKQGKPILRLAMVWISFSFIPYMFVDYVHSIPSRQTYLASLGLALVVGAALTVLKDRTQQSRGWLVRIVLATILVHNVGYLWLVKHQQFLLRAQPTEQLIAFTRRASGRIYVRCFPRPQIIGDAAVKLMADKPSGTLIWNEAEAREENATETFCYEPR